MFKFLMGRPATYKEQAQLYKTLSLLLSGEVFLLSAVSMWAMNQQDKRYRLLWQQYEILAEHANWEDPMIKIKMEELRRFREITDPKPPKDED